MRNAEDMGVVATPRERSPSPVVTRPQALVIDDYLESRVAMAELLEEEGFHVLQADTLLRARRLVALCGQVRVMVTNVRLPDGPAEELVRAFREVWPSLPVLYVSGQPGTTDRFHRTRLAEGTAFLRKPLDLDLLGRTVTALRDSCS